MSWKLEAAYHEAGHALLASLSPFHNVVGPINLAQYGAGEIYVGLSRSKCVAAGKSPTAASRQDPDVARDFALIMVAGLVAERIAAEHNDKIVPNAECARPDHDLLVQNLARAGLSKKFDRFEQEAAGKLRGGWTKVEALATALFAAGSCSPDQIDQYLA